MPMTLDQWKKYRNRILVETGSATGKAIADALAAGFEEVRSVELSPHWFAHCCDRFVGDFRVKLYLGLSEEKLPEMLADIIEPVTFWLDGHYSGKGTAKGPKSCPIFEELACIRHHAVKTHTILIDDMRLWTSSNVGFGRETIEQAVRSINLNYAITYEPGIETGVIDDILVARIP